MLIQSLISNVYAESSNEQFRFEQTTYLLKGEYDDAAIHLVLPKGYTMKDVEILSENENIVHIFEISDNYYMESLAVGETRLKAVIKSTNYVTYCNVKVEEPIHINIAKKNVGVTLDIDNYCPYWWSIDTKQACEISISSIKNQGEEKWIRLGEGIYGSALNKKYSYDISENCIVTVRWISWWNGVNYKGEDELYRKTIVIDDMEPISSIGAHIKIYANNQNETSSTMHIGDTLKLNTEIVEIPNNTPITWKSYQENVATVDSNGIVKVTREGTARIEATATVTNTDGHTSTYTDVYPIIVQDNTVITTQQLLETNGAVSGIIPSKVSVGNNEQAFIKGNGLDISWSSRNNEIATVNKEGLIQGISKGDVTIDANITYNNATYHMIQKVKVSDGKEETNKEQKENNKVQDTTVAKKILPQTGQHIAIVVMGAFLIILIVTDE